MLSSDLRCSKIMEREKKDLLPSEKGACMGGSLVEQDVPISGPAKSPESSILKSIISDF